MLYNDPCNGVHCRDLSGVFSNQFSLFLVLCRVAFVDVHFNKNVLGIEQLVFCFSGTSSDIHLSVFMFVMLRR